MRRSDFYFYTSLLFTAIAPGVYIMYAMGIFEEGVVTTQTAVASGLYIGLGFMVYQLLRTLQKKANDRDNPNIKHRAYGAALSHATPWTLLMLFTGLVHFGITQIVVHTMYIVSLELIGSVFIGKSKYWELTEQKADKGV